MKYGYREYLEAVYMAAQHSFRFTDWSGEEVFYCPASLCFRTPNNTVADSVGSHIEIGRFITPEEKLFIHPETKRLFAPKVGDLWIRENYADCYYIRHEEDLSFFIQSLQRRPDEWFLSMRGNKPVIKHERVDDETAR